MSTSRTLEPFETDGSSLPASCLHSSRSGSDGTGRSAGTLTSYGEFPMLVGRRT